MQDACEILVCQAGSCRRAGSEAVLLEIEELTKDQQCSVQASGCLGACSRAPNVVVVNKCGTQEISEALYARLDGVEKCADMVHKATGHAPNLDDPALRVRLKAARQLRVRHQARQESKWNTAMAGIAEDIAGSADENDKLELKYELAQLCCSAGRCEQALELLADLEAVIGGNQLVLMEKGKALGKLGRTEELRALVRHVSRGLPRTMHVVSTLKLCLKDAQAASSVAGGSEPCRIEGYACWTLAGVTPMSKHSAVYHLTSSDCKRGTPYTRGRGRTIWHRTWHTTMLAEVGPNPEGPLPWVERDYTPLSTCKEWECGSCDILIKIYRKGAATSWLHRQPLGQRLWLSQPRKTLGVPSLVADGSRLSSKQRQHRGVLLVLGGTGIVAAAQVLHHMDLTTCFGTSSTGQANPPLTSPVSLVAACRRDDVLLTGDLATWCSAGAGRARLQRCVLAISPPQNDSGDAGGEAAPFPNAPETDLDALRALPNVCVVESRLTQELLEHELAPLRSLGACRVVVSGPESFNQAMKEMLVRGAGLDAEAVTVLEA